MDPGTAFGGALSRRSGVLVFLAGALAALALLWAPPSARADTNAACTASASSAWFPYCVVHVSCTTQSFIRTAHASSLPYKVWNRVINDGPWTYHGQHSTLDYIFPDFPDTGNVSHQVDQSSPTTTYWHAGHYSCV